VCSVDARFPSAASSEIGGALSFIAASSMPLQPRRGARD
jgi:hypothetical protein